MTKYQYRKLTFGLLLMLRTLQSVLGQSNATQFERYLPDYSVTLLTAKDGLSQGSVYFMYRDSRDYMWFSSYEGLNRYDSKQFKIYHNRESPTHGGMMGTAVYGITEDKRGNLWVGTEEGLNCLNRKTDEFIPHTNISSTPQQVHPFYADSTTVWYVGSEDGLVEFDFIKKQKFVRNADIKVRNDFFQVFEVQRTESGDMWIPSTTDRAGITRYNSKTGQFDYFFSNHKQNVFGTPTAFYAFYFDDTEGVLWLGMSEGLMRFDPQTKAVSVFKSADINFTLHTIYSIIKDNRGIVWLATEGSGLILFDPKTQQFQRFQAETQFSNALNRYPVSALYYDKVKDILWANLEPMGIMKIMYQRWSFRHYRHDPILVNSLSQNSARCFTTDDEGKVWIGTLTGGINIFDPKTETFQRISTTSNNPAGLPHNNILKLFRDHKNQIWVGTVAGLALYEPIKHRFTTYLNKPQVIDAINANTTRNILELPDGFFLVGTEGGVFSFNPVTKKFYSQPILANEVILSIHWDSLKQQVWIGTVDRGVFVYAYDKGQLTQVSSGLSAISVTYIHQKGDFFWLTTNKGLVKINTVQRDTQIFTRAHGLPSNYLYNCLEDNNNNLWISTNYGISRFNMFDNSFFNFTPQQGLQGYEYNGQGCLKTESGEFYFGGVEGFDRFSPDKIVEQPYSFPTRIISFKVNNQLYSLDGSLDEKHEIWLKHTQNTLQITFQAIDNHSNGTNKYRFKLMPFQTEWVYSDINSVNYAQLKSADYTFIVQASTETGVWVDSYATIQVHLSPPFWEIWWFRILASILLVSLVYYFFEHNRKRSLKIMAKEQSFQRRLAEMEMAALRSQMNPHFIFNVLNSINDYMLNHDTRAASQYLTDFSRLIRLVLEHSRNEKITLASELEALNLYLKFEQLRFEDKLRYKIEVDNSIDQHYSKVPPLIIQPYVENAIWHGLMHQAKGGSVSINVVQEDENILLITIQDDGIGRVAAAELKSKSAVRKKSLGMSMTSNRIQLVNEIYKTKTEVDVKDLFDDNGKACGTLVTLRIPV